MNGHHQPVLPDEAIGLLDLSPGKTVVDGTIGLGGHSSEILKRITPGGRLIGIDLDEAALRIAQANLAPDSDKTNLFHDNFANLENILKNLSIKGVDGILLDLGFSSFQLSEAGRGFSFLSTAPLDMRMNQSAKSTVKDIINKARLDELIRIFQDYGEERWSKRIAKAIVNSRQKHPIETTEDLVGIIQSSIPYKGGNIHPATRVFQALRIAVNGELDNLSKFLQTAENNLNPKGRLVIISFHSLEDRLVKRAFIDKKVKNIFKIITKKPITPTRDEMDKNPRSRSAKLRVAEKV
ncbi:MAG: 16S rRNA (cytosine(1402)-N(4))-methyltransferase RsmH [Planctomycetes bacterium]|nr:16S rRNA (cytosine(1402)-N(4))-methyltransferase RsmH [Planctomycetota bacterium]